jgi:hypothetical protein
MSARYNNDGPVWLDDRTTVNTIGAEYFYNFAHTQIPNRNSGGSRPQGFGDAQLWPLCVNNNHLEMEEW